MSARKFRVEDAKKDRFPSLNAVKVANEARGRRETRAYWFGNSEMRHFGTRIETALLGGQYFVTSEWKDYAETVRAFSVREALTDGSIDTYWGFPRVRFERRGATRDRRARSRRRP